MASEDSMKRTVEANQKCFDSGHKEVLILCKRCFAAAIDEAVEDLRTQIATSADVVNAALTEAGADHRQVDNPYCDLHLRDAVDDLWGEWSIKVNSARAAAFREWDEKGWLSHANGCEPNKRVWLTEDGPPRCTCGLDAEHAKHEEA